MLPNTIVLAVDELNNGTPVNETLSRFEENLNRTVYVGENHTVQTKDLATFYRTAPKPTGNFPGVAKTTVKFSRDLTVTGNDGISTIAAPAICEVSFSIPVGTSAADMLLLRQRVMALLDLDAVMVPFQTQLMI